MTTDFWDIFWGYLSWNLWQRWGYRWKHRNDTLAETRAELYRQWERYLETVKDEPARKELLDAVEGMNEIRKVFGDK